MGLRRALSVGASALAIAVVLPASLASGETPDPNGDPHARACHALQQRISSVVDNMFPTPHPEGELYWEDWAYGIAALEWLLQQWEAERCALRYGTALPRRVGGGGEFDTRPSNWAVWSEAADEVLVGDFDGDQRSDLVALGDGVTHDATRTLPVAFSQGDGSFNVVSHVGIGSIAPGSLAWFLHQSSDPLKALNAKNNVKRVVGDFNDDGLSDIALVGGTGFTSVPVALSTGLTEHGIEWSTRNPGVPAWFAAKASAWNARVVVGNFDGVGGDDIALVGGTGWTEIAVAHANADGTFTTASYLPRPNGSTNCAAPAAATVYCSQFLTWAIPTKVRPLVADYNGDGVDDIALVGETGDYIPVAFAISKNGPQVAATGFTVRRDANAWFAASTRDQTAPLGTKPTVQVLAADYDDNGLADLAAFGTHDPFEQAVACSPIAASRLSGTVLLKKHAFVASLDCQTMLMLSNVHALTAQKIVTGDFNNDGRADIAATGGSAKANFVGVLMARSDGSYDYHDKYIP